MNIFRGVHFYLKGEGEWHQACSFTTAKASHPTALPLGCGSDFHFGGP
jgi:hypothetical protein